MPNFQFEEGRIRFSFVDAHIATQYDNWRYYKKHFQKAAGSSKAVDFIVCKDDVAWLIEVKDFRRHRRTKPIELCDEIAQKVRDTMAGILSAQFHANDCAEKSCASSVSACTHLKVGLHLQQAKNPNRLFPHDFNPANLTLKLKQQLRFADCHPKVFNIESFPENLGSAESI